jgi:hypothetical protein
MLSNMDDNEDSEDRNSACEKEAKDQQVSIVKLINLEFGDLKPRKRGSRISLGVCGGGGGRYLCLGSVRGAVGVKEVKINVESK